MGSWGIFEITQLPIIAKAVYLKIGLPIFRQFDLAPILVICNIFRPVVQLFPQNPSFRSVSCTNARTVALREWANEQSFGQEQRPAPH
jgi:hypothetical protein